MALPEEFAFPGGFELCISELSGKTRRNSQRPREWAGLAGAESVLLYRWVCDVGAGLDDFHTDVELGMVVGVNEKEDPAWYAKMVRGLHPLRVDCVALVKGRWRIVEVKMDAGYVAMGQVLTYGFYATRCIVPVREFGLLVVTDAVQPCMRAVYANYGVEVAEVGLG